MPSDQQHVWMVQLSLTTEAIPVARPEVADLFRDAGWQVTELPLAAFEPVELRCLRIDPGPHPSS